MLKSMMCIGTGYFTFRPLRHAWKIWSLAFGTDPGFLGRFNCGSLEGTSLKSPKQCIFLFHNVLAMYGYGNLRNIFSTVSKVKSWIDLEFQNFHGFFFQPPTPTHFCVFPTCFWKQNFPNGFGSAGRSWGRLMSKSRERRTQEILGEDSMEKTATTTLLREHQHETYGIDLHIYIYNV